MVKANEQATNGNGNGSKATPLADLMKRMGGTGQFDPLPPDQRRWQGAEGEAPLHRIWSEMVSCTVGNHGRRSEYAVDQYAHELSIEDLAKRIGMDPGCARSVWREGKNRGLWRNGSKEEGSRRCYLLARVQISTERRTEDEEEANEKVCTNLLPSLILKKTKDWPPERVAELGRKWRAIEEFQRDLVSISVAAARSFISQEQNNLLAQFGVKIQRQKHQRKGESEDKANERRENNPLLPAIENFVQTLREKVGTASEKTLYNGENHSVQTSIYKELEFRDLEARPSGRAESKPPARPEVVSQSPPHQNGKTKTEDWRPELREWLRENCPVKTALDDVMFERIAFWLTPELLGQFREAALQVTNPRKWPIYESVAKQVAGRGEVPDASVSRKDQRRQEWEQHMLQKYGKEA